MKFVLALNFWVGLPVILYALCSATGAGWPFGIWCGAAGAFIILTLVDAARWLRERIREDRKES